MTNYKKYFFYVKILLDNSLIFTLQIKHKLLKWQQCVSSLSGLIV